MEADTGIEPEPRKRRRSGFNPPMPWFGIDIGGSLVKLVYFEPDLTPNEEAQPVKTIRKYLTSTLAYGDTGRRDSHLEMRNVPIDGQRGTLHFIRFPTLRMESFLKMARSKGFSQFSSTVCATGGGAFKYETEIRRELGLSFHKFDEIDSLISGIHYIEANYPEETYYWEKPLNPEQCKRVPYEIRHIYPYLVVNIGSGVSILAVHSRTKYERIGGTSIGGATFLGLCCLLTGCQSYDEAIDLASRGDNTPVDKLVGDIYGGDYNRYNLSSDIVASSFAHMMDPERRKAAKKEDLARSVLVTVTNNIGGIAMQLACNAGIKRVLFLGNFLRINPLSMKLLADAMDYWSEGQTKALFMEHEGYFGAVGCLQELMKTGYLTGSSEADGWDALASKPVMENGDFAVDQK